MHDCAGGVLVERRLLTVFFPCQSASLTLLCMLQAYYLAATFAVERAPTAPVPAWKRRRDVSIATIEEYPVKGLVFEAGAALPEMAELIGKACHRLAAANVPHNLFVVDRGQRAFLFPNGFSIAKAKGAVPAELLDTQVAVSCYIIAALPSF